MFNCCLFGITRFCLNLSEQPRNYGLFTFPHIRAKNLKNDDDNNTAAAACFSRHHLDWHLVFNFIITQVWNASVLQVVYVCVHNRFEERKNLNRYMLKIVLIRKINWKNREAWHTDIRYRELLFFWNKLKSWEISKHRDCLKKRKFYSWIYYHRLA